MSGSDTEDGVEGVVEPILKRRSSSSHFSLDRLLSFPNLAALKKSYIRTIVWGRGDFGQLGNGQNGTIRTPQLNDHLGDRDVRCVAGNLFNSAIITGDGELFTTGSNSEHQIGTSKIDQEMITVPQRVIPLENFQILHVACGQEFMLAVTEHGKLASWGLNDLGQAGHGRREAANTISKPSFIKSTDSVNFVRVAAGQQHSVALTGGGQVYTFGSGHFGALGHGNYNNVIQPLIIDTLWEIGIVQVSCGENFSAALSADGRMFTWGHGKYGQLGLGNFDATNVPSEVKFAEEVKLKQICCGGNHTLALGQTSQGQMRVFSWGQGTWGQTGLGHVENVSIPNIINEFDGMDAAQLSAGSRHSLVLTKDNALYGFGNNESGQTGQLAEEMSMSTPQLILGFDGYLILFVAAFGEGNIAIVQQLPNSKNMDGCNDLNGQLVAGPMLQGHKHGKTCLPLELPRLLEVVREANETKEFGYLNRVVEDVFSSPGLLLTGFTNRIQMQQKQLSQSLKVQESEHSLDLDSVSLIYKLLINPDNPSIIVHLGSACLQILYQLQALLADGKVEVFMCMRLLLILIQNPLNVHQQILEDERLGPQLLLLYLGVIRQFQQQTINYYIFLSWLRELEPEVFGRDLVRATQEFISSTTSSRQWPSARQIIKPMLNLLGIFYEASSYGDVDVIPFRKFHNSEVCKDRSIQMEYKYWFDKSEWSLLDFPFVLTPEAKSQFVNFEALTEQSNLFHLSTFEALISGQRMLRMGSIGFFSVSIRRSDVVRDAMTKILYSNPRDFKKKLRVKFVSNEVEEEGQDEGGLTKEFFQLLTKDLFDLQYGMFSYDQVTRTYWFRNHLELDAEQKLEYELIGIICGLAIYNGVLLDVHFPLVVYKKLLGQIPNLADLKRTFPELGRGLQQLLEFEGDVENTFLRDFTIQQESFEEMVVKELKPSGADIPVTNENREEYVQAYVKFVLTDSVSQQFESFNNGFKKVCDLGPKRVLSLFRAEELEQLVCGLPHLDFRALEQNTKYDGGYERNHPAIKMFWEIINELTLTQKKKFLAFCTGSDRAPVGGLGTMQFIVQRGGPDTEKLPTSHTCFNVILLPEYKSKEKMKVKLLTAIENAEGFGLR